jgi:hypothetical protein
LDEHRPTPGAVSAAGHPDITAAAATAGEQRVSVRADLTDGWTLYVLFVRAVGPNGRSCPTGREPLGVDGVIGAGSAAWGVHGQRGRLDSGEGDLRRYVAHELSA